MESEIMDDIKKAIDEAELSRVGCEHIYGFEDDGYDTTLPGSGFLIYEPGQVYVDTYDIKFTFCPLCGERLK